MEADVRPERKASSAQGRRKEVIMNIPEFIDLAIEIELIVSDLYQLIAANTTDPPLAKQLGKLSQEELNHANILQAGKSYYAALPDLFADLAISEREAREAFKEATEHHALFFLKQTPILRQIKMMLDFERRFEKLHLDVSVKINDQALKTLFINLKKGDHSHIATLSAMLDMLKERL
jgi:rubrerythrin